MASMTKPPLCHSLPRWSGTTHLWKEGNASIYLSGAWWHMPTTPAPRKAATSLRSAQDQPELNETDPFSKHSKATTKTNLSVYLTQLQVAHGKRLMSVSCYLCFTMALKYFTVLSINLGANILPGQVLSTAVQSTLPRPGRLSLYLAHFESTLMVCLDLV